MAKHTKQPTAVTLLPYGAEPAPVVRRKPSLSIRLDPKLLRGLEKASTKFGVNKTYYLNLALKNQLNADHVE
jgi:hypothetical protein